MQVRLYFPFFSTLVLGESPLARWPTKMACRQRNSRNTFADRDLKRVQGQYSGYSDKFALLVSCSYANTPNSLEGTPRDLMRAYEWIQNEPMRIPVQNITVLTDDPQAAQFCGSQGKPNRNNIMTAMRTLAKKSSSGTLQFFAVSGGRTVGVERVREIARTRSSTDNDQEFRQRCSIHLGLLGCVC